MGGKGSILGESWIFRAVHEYSRAVMHRHHGFIAVNGLQSVNTQYSNISLHHKRHYTSRLSLRQVCLGGFANL